MTQPADDPVLQLRVAILRRIRFHYRRELEAWNALDPVQRSKPAPKWDEFGTIIDLVKMPLESLEKFAALIGA